MRTLAIFNDDVAYDLGLSLDDLYIIGYIHTIRNTTLVETKIITNEEYFTFNLVNLFKARPLIFKKIKFEEGMSDEAKEVLIKQTYDLNLKRLNRMIKNELGKVLIKGKTIRHGEGSKTYYKLNKSVLTVLINGYAKVIDEDLTDNEKLLVEATGIINIPKGTRTQLKGMDTEILKEAIEVAKEKEILDFPFIKGVYKNLIANKKADTAPTVTTDINKNINDSNSIHQNSKKNTKKNIPTVKTRYHNINESFREYTPEELEKKLQESQRDKFINKDINQNKELPNIIKQNENQNKAEWEF